MKTPLSILGRCGFEWLRVAKAYEVDEWAHCQSPVASNNQHQPNISIFCRHQSISLCRLYYAASGRNISTIFLGQAFFDAVIDISFTLSIGGDATSRHRACGSASLAPHRLYFRQASNVLPRYGNACGRLPSEQFYHIRHYSGRFCA